MNNKRLIFYLINLLVLLSLYVVFVNAVAPTTEGAIEVTVAQIQSGGVNISNYNITTGRNLNITCSAVVFTSSQRIANISLFHNFHGFASGSNNISMNVTNTSASPFNYTHVLEQNGTLNLLRIRFKAFNASTVTYDANGANTGNLLIADGNYTVACQAGLNATSNASYTLQHRKNFSANRTITIDKARPVFSISSLNVSDGTNTVVLVDLNGTTGNNAYLRNGTNLKVSISVDEPHLYSARIYWLFNGSPLAADTGALSSTNPNNMTMNNQHSPFTSNNDTILNGSLRFAGKDANGSGEVRMVDSLTDLAEGRSIIFMIVANDSAGNTVNVSNNGRGFNITLDGTAPGSVLSLSKSRIAVENTITATCETNDTSKVIFTVTLTKPNGATITKSQSGGFKFEPEFKATETGQAGKYKIKCSVEDSVQFSTTSEKEFTAFYEGDEGVSVEEEAEEQKVAEVDLSRSVDGSAPEGEVSGLQGESSTFTLDGETQHTLTFLKVTATSATIRLESTPNDITLNVGESREVDLDGDGDNDVVVKLTSVQDEEAKVMIKPVKIPPKVEETPTQPSAPAEAEKPGKAGVIVVVLLILAVVVAAYFLLKGKGKKKKGEIRFTSKDLSSEFKF
ncbi:MAG: hypothetical protein AABW58_01275 [Nanoarchaeota archaeon]